MGEKKRRLAAAASLEARLEAAHGLRLGGHADEAQAAYARIVALDPVCAGAWLGLGLLARAAGANDAGVRHLARAVALAPEDADARLHYAWALQDREDFDQSRIHWRALCALRPHDAVAWESLGIVEQAAGNIDEALAAYARAIAIEPSPAREVKLATAISPIASFFNRSVVSMARSVRLGIKTNSRSLCNSPPTGPRESTTASPAATSLFPSEAPPLGTCLRDSPSSRPQAMT